MLTGVPTDASRQKQGFLAGALNAYRPRPRRQSRSAAGTTRLSRWCRKSLAMTPTAGCRADG
jgi:hypothetical protein